MDSRPISLSVCMPIHLFVCLFVPPYNCLSLCIASPSVRFSFKKSLKNGHQANFLDLVSLPLSVCMPVHLFICLFVPLYNCLSVLLVHLSIPVKNITEKFGLLANFFGFRMILFRFLCLSACLSTCLSVCLFLLITVCLSVLLVHLSIPVKNIIEKIGLLANFFGAE